MKIKEYINEGHNNYYINRYPKDINRMIKVCKEQFIDLAAEEAAEIWEAYSDDFSAGWLTLPDYDSELFDIIIEYAEKLWKENN